MLFDAFVNVSEKRKFTLFMHAPGKWYHGCQRFFLVEGDRIEQRNREEES